MPRYGRNNTKDIEFHAERPMLVVLHEGGNTIYERK